MNDILNDYGLAGLIITVLAGVIVVMARYIVTLWNRISELQDNRVKDAQAFQDIVTGPLNAQSTISKQIYELLLNLINERRP